MRLKAIERPRSSHHLSEQLINIGDDIGIQRSPMKLIPSLGEIGQPSVQRTFYETVLKHNAHPDTIRYVESVLPRAA